MRILFAGHKARGLACLNALVTRERSVIGVVGHAAIGQPCPLGSVAAAGRTLGVPVFEANDLSDADLVASLRALSPDIVVLAGYGPILRGAALEIAPLGAVNLHAGRLPEYRGSSPLNWVLINGEERFTLSVISVDRGVDTGDVLLERTFPIGPHETIADLHRIANAEFPTMLLEVLDRVADGTAQRRQQDERRAAYYPLRFPDDGGIVWDLLTAAQVHNRVRALTKPYPGAFTFADRRRVMLLGSKPAVRTYYGEPGRIYLKSQRGLLVCASDKCLWITEAVFADDGSNAIEQLPRYSTFSTVRRYALTSSEQAVLT